jgi:putative transport protein
MDAFSDLASRHPIAHAILVLSVVIVLGLSVGGLKYRGLGLGTVGVLFSGIVAGHFGWTIEPAVLDFVKEFGLILFVFTIGLQLGPGFLAALRRNGLALNSLALVIVLLGGGLTVLLAKLGINPFAALGLFSGATTNTPSLGAAQQTLGTLAAAKPAANLPVLAYAVAYPVGILGIIGALLLLKVMFRIDPEAEARRFNEERHAGIAPLTRVNLVVENPNLAGTALGDIPGLRETGVVISRYRRAGETQTTYAANDTLLQPGDILLAVGTAGNLERFRRIVGRRCDVDLMKMPGLITYRRVLVTRREVLGKTVEELGLDHLYNVTVTRVTRADIEMTAVPELRLQFGDQLYLVGDEAGLQKAEQAVGNSLRELNATHFVPVFTGIALGVIVGLVPLQVPGLPVPVKLGLAGGPLVMAILLARVGHFGPLVWHMPVTANLAFRELGITLFLACVGLGAGEKFFGTVFAGTGPAWLGAATVITTIPLLLVGIFARRRLQLNYMSISGLLAGSMTDPPALAFASSISKSDAPSVAYATVYPLTMLLRILSAQLLALLLCG